VIFAASADIVDESSAAIRDQSVAVMLIKPPPWHDMNRLPVAWLNDAGCWLAPDDPG